MTKYDVLIMLLVVILVSSIIGGQLGYTVNGVPQGASDYISEEENNPWIPDFIEGFTDAIGATVGFVWHMITFGIDGVPFWVSMVFLAMNLLTLYLGYNAIRGNG